MRWTLEGRPLADRKESAKPVVLEHLHKVFSDRNGREVHAVSDIVLTVAGGEMVTLLGPSGCGKTTTLRMVAGFESPSSGRIHIGDRDVTNLPPNARDAAMVFQSYALFPHMTVRENIAYGLRFRKVARSERADRVQRIMELVGLSGLGDRSPSKLSGGQQQRVALARALVVEPQVLLFDEPLSNLDARLREQMRAEIRRIQQRLAITAIYVTHDQAEAMTLSDRVVVMRSGEVMQVGTPVEIYSQPANTFVAEFIGKVNFLPAEVLGGAASRQPAKGEAGSTTDAVRLRVSGQELIIGKDGLTALPDGALTPGRYLTVVVRPEALALVEAEAGLMKGRIVHATYLGASAEYIVETNQGQELSITTLNPATTGLRKAGETVGLTFSTSRLHVLAETREPA